MQVAQVTVINGNRVPEESTRKQASEAVESYFRKHELHGVDYFRLNEDGSIELKISTGFKVVVRTEQIGRATNFEVILC